MQNMTAHQVKCTCTMEISPWRTKQYIAQSQAFTSPAVHTRLSVDGKEGERVRCGVDISALLEEFQSKLV